MNSLSNDDLARFLQHNGAAAKPVPDTSQPPPESLAAKRESKLGAQQWPLGERMAHLDPLSEWERKALFVTLTRGTTANLLREPTVAEFLLLIQRVDEARALVSSAEQAIANATGVYFREGEVVFTGSAPRRKRVIEQVDAA